MYDFRKFQSNQNKDKSVHHEDHGGPYAQHVDARATCLKHLVGAIGHKQPAAHNSHHARIVKLFCSKEQNIGCHHRKRRIDRRGGGKKPVDRIHDMCTGEANDNTHTRNQEKLQGCLLHREGSCKNRGESKFKND